MYRHCIYCAADFGENREIEGFPIGSQLAFDAGRGRLWAVCRRCQRWNLAPVEERWEAVEQAERCFRGTSLRAQHENVGVARLDSGMLLVRIGDALPEEEAAWRYGSEFRKRRRRHQVSSAANTVSALALGFWIPSSFTHGRRVVLANAGRPVRLSQLAGAEFSREGSVLRLGLAAREGWFRSAPTVRLEGDEVEAVLGRVLPAVNHRGANQTLLDDALAHLKATGSPVARLHQSPGGGEAAWSVRLREWAGSWCLCEPDEGERTRFPGVVEPAIALAMEMSLQAELERAALAGRLTQLTRAWQDAAEIAAIADSL